MSWLSPFTEWGHVFWASWCDWMHPCFYVGAQIEYQTHFHICIKCSSSKLKHSRNMPVKRVPLLGIISSVQSLSRVWLFATPWIAARQASLSINNSRSLLKLMSIESVIPCSHLILCRPFSSCPQSLPASGSFPMSQLFAWGGQSIGVSASASVLPMNISSRMDWLDLPEVQGTLWPT